jgi:pimeloyl-ACP methyl ester carboxylesterase
MKQAIIVIGGFNSFWPIYLKMARDLEDLTGVQAIGVPLWPWHWWSAGQAQDASNILQKVAETVVWARRKYRAGQFILVGHSAGGVVGRLYLCDEPVWGQVYAGVEYVPQIITLGSPHCSQKGTETGWFLTDEANRHAAGTPYADRVRYRAVAGCLIEGREDGSYQERQAFRRYRFFAGQGALWGDGTVPVESAHLDGSECLVLEGVGHSRKTGPDWYGGSPSIIRRWWPDEAGHGR